MSEGRIQLTATVITLNEEKNVERCLRSLSWVDEIIVVDSQSQDRTREIAESLGARVISRAWPGYGQQKNFALDQARHEWVLSLDADEEVSPELRAEIQSLLQKPDCDGYEIPRKTFFLGRWIKYGGWYPNYQLRLARKSKARWTEPELHERLAVEGRVRKLKQPIFHYTFENIESQVRTNLKYSRAGYYELSKKNAHPSIPRLVLKPLGKFIETYLVKKGFLDGVPGLIISANAAHSMFLKHAYGFEPGSEEKREK